MNVRAGLWPTVLELKFSMHPLSSVYQGQSATRAYQTNNTTPVFAIGCCIDAL